MTLNYIKVTLTLNNFKLYLIKYVYYMSDSLKVG